MIAMTETKESPVSSRTLMYVTVIAMVAAMFGVAAAEAGASAEIHNFSVTRSTSQAGGHPDVNVAFEPDYWDSPQLKGPCQCNTPKNIEVELPTGMIGNPHATPQCTATEFVRQECPSDAQIGEIFLKANIGGEPIFDLDFELPLWNMVPRPSQAGLIAWQIPVFEGPVYTVLSARTGSDYGLDAINEGVLQRFSIVKIRQEMWGVPAEPSHDAYRVNIPNSGGKGTPSSSPPTPFLSNPTVCGGPQTSFIHVLAYDKGTSDAESTWSPTTGCDQLTFNPSLSAQPTTTDADSASGLEVNLTVPQEESPTTPSPSEIRDAVVELPAGFSINPSAADGKTSCTDAQARFGTEEEAQCPEFSKIGTDTLESSALPAPLPGAMYLGEPQPGNRYRVFLTADGFATHIKIAGSARLDPQTGRVVVSFENLPQSPLTSFNLHIFGSERGLLATPTACGTYSVHSTFVPWDESLESQEATQLFSIDSGPGGAPCPGSLRPFGPSFTASSESNAAGAHSPFSIFLSRQDGDQNLSALDVSPPPGLLATLRGISYCSDAALAAAADPAHPGLTEEAKPSCPASSLIGSATTAAGAGTHPVSLPGKVYLAGPYKGAPLSLAVITPAVSGPYDLGNVVVRAALQVDPETARVTAISDPLPSILEGIPLRVRSILVTLDRPGFTVNPTNCEQSAVGATIFGDQGAQASLSSPFQVANCAALPYEPKLALELSGGLNRRGHPAIHADLKQEAGEANSRRISVALPTGEQLDNSHFGTVCTKPLFATNSCPPGSMIGQAEAKSPLLDAPLKGSVYLRSSSHGLPDMAIDLEGQIDITLVGRIDTAKPGRLRSTFSTVPDAPITSFSLDLLGGRKGLVQNTEGLCGKNKMATVRMKGQNGVSDNEQVKLGLACGGKARHKRHHTRHAERLG